MTGFPADIVFVFGSNLAGRHGAGAALDAERHWGARRGHGWGRQGQSFAIPTKDGELRTLPLEVVAHWVGEFMSYAGMHPRCEFQVTAIGCGLAGYSPAQIAPLFRNAPANCHLPLGWRAANPPESPRIAPVRAPGDPNPG